MCTKLLHKNGEEEPTRTESVLLLKPKVDHYNLDATPQHFEYSFCKEA